MNRWQPALGAVVENTGTRFRVWAPVASAVELVDYQGERSPMERDGEYWQTLVAGAGHGFRYGYRVDGEGPFPDPCSRWQPDGVHGLSAAVDPRAFAWTDADWEPPDVADLVIYEAHIGTLTEGGTFDSAIAEFGRLHNLGVNTIEVMPVAAFPGRWNWGYDGVALFAPQETYGGPDGMRRFVDAAHATGLAVVLDVVYNHFGPDGNYTGVYSPRYTTDEFDTPWGAAINFADPDVRAFYVENALHWTHEYHIDGFRFDATHAIVDPSETHILAEISEALEASPRVPERRPYLIAESHENDVRYLRGRDEGGFAFEAVWADDFHHGVRTVLLDEQDGYFSTFAGTAAELASTATQGFLYEGQFDAWANAPRGTPSREQPWRQFVYCIQNHDQVGNRGFGERLHVDAGRAEVLAATVLLLLLPQTPLLFQGQEFMASSPFLYFTDHNEDLGRLVTEGRRREFAGFAAFTDPATRERIPDPQAEETYRRSILRSDEAEYGLGALAQDLHAELLRLRREDPVLRAARRERPEMRVVSRDDALALELGEREERRVIVANFGKETTLEIPGASQLTPLIVSTASRFGGNGREVEIAGDMVTLPGHCGVYLASR